MEEKKRLVVSDGSKRVERLDNKGQWETYKVEDQGGLKNGVYVLHQAMPVKPDSKGTYVGTIIHADKYDVYQDLGDKGLVRFDRDAFPEAPEIGRHRSIQFEYGRARIDGRVTSAGVRALDAVIEKQMDADGLQPQQRAIVTARVQHNLANSIAAGKHPELKLREGIHVQRDQHKDKEQSR